MSPLETMKQQNNVEIMDNDLRINKRIMGNFLGSAGKILESEHIRLKPIYVLFLHG